MKKLIIAAVAIAMSVAANAASVKWTTKFEVADGTKTGLTSATIAYLVDVNVLSQSSLYDAVMGGATLADAVSGKTLNSASMTDGAISATTWDLGAGYAGGDKMTAYMVLFDDNLNALYISEEITKTLQAVQTQNYAFQNDSSIDGIAADMSGFDKSYGGWVQTVPEPTSGLLLILGMAGLALKRKQA